MCPVEKGNIVSCQLSFIPIGNEEYLDEINKVLSLIKETGLEYNVGILSTTVRGYLKIVLDLIADINKSMSISGCSYTMNILLSNTCGC